MTSIEEAVIEIARRKDARRLDVLQFAESLGFDCWIVLTEQWDYLPHSVTVRWFLECHDTPPPGAGTHAGSELYRVENGKVERVVVTFGD